MHLCRVACIGGLAGHQLLHGPRGALWGDIMLTAAKPHGLALRQVDSLGGPEAQNVVNLNV